MISWFHHLSDTLKHWIDALAIGVAAASVIKALPEIAATLSVVWTLLRIYESRTVTMLIKRFRERRGAAPSDSQG